MAEMLLMQRGLDLIKSFEQLRLKAYRNFPGEPWTIGWGHTGPDVKPTTVWTPAIADTALLLDTHDAVMAVNRALAVPVNQNQFDALVCFTYNVGTGAMAHSALMAHLNNCDDPRCVADEFLKWNHVDGVVVPGLTARRKAEQFLFNLPEEAT